MISRIVSFGVCFAAVVALSGCAGSGRPYPGSYRGETFGNAQARAEATYRTGGAVEAEDARRRPSRGARTSGRYYTPINPFLGTIGNRSRSGSGSTTNAPSRRAATFQNSFRVGGSDYDPVAGY